VVRSSNEDMLIICDTEKRCAQRDLGSQIEIMPCRLPDGVCQPVGRPCGGVDNLPAEVGPLGLEHALLGYPVGSDEQCAQALVTVHHIRKRGTQHIGIKPPAQPQCGSQVVNR
jgi:hypothetical protein